MGFIASLFFNFTTKKQQFLGFDKAFLQILCLRFKGLASNDKLVVFIDLIAILFHQVTHDIFINSTTLLQFKSEFSFGVGGID